MKKKSSKIVRRTAAEVRRRSRRELARIAELPPGSPDAENPEWTAEQLASAAEARRRRIAQRAGRVRKRRITIHLDEDLLAYFKALGERGYQTRINDALRAHVAGRAAGTGDPRDLIEQARAALDRAGRILEEDSAA